MNVLGVIPVRMASTRLPGKPLADICGKPLVQHVWEKASQCTLFSEVVIATDSPEIVTKAKKFGASVMMTSSDARTGSDRVAEVALHFEREGKHFDFVANVQGDMPFIKAAIIEEAICALADAPRAIGMSTIATPISSREEFERPSVVKAVMGANNRALYFSRAPIPYPRSEPRTGEPFGFKHIGLYVFKPEILKVLAGLSPALSEEREGLEQLRLLSNGISIVVAVVDRSVMEPSIEVDTPEDLDRARTIAAR